MESNSSRNSLSPTKDNLNRRGNANPRMMNSPVAKANMKYPASKRLGLFNTGDLLQGNKESEKISDVLRRNGGHSIIIPDLCHEISFDTPNPQSKNPWKMFGEFIFKKNLNMSYLVNIRNCK